MQPEYCRKRRLPTKLFSQVSFMDSGGLLQNSQTTWQNPSILKPASNHQVCTVYVVYIQWFMIQHNPISTLFSFWLQKIGTPLSGLQRGPGLAMQGQQCPTLLFHSDCCSCGPLSPPTVHMIHLTVSQFWLLSKNQLSYSLIQWGFSAGVGPLQNQ